MGQGTSGYLRGGEVYTFIQLPGRRFGKEPPKCRICGNPFEPTTRTQVACQGCRAENDRRVERQRQQQKRLAAKRKQEAK